MREGRSNGDSVMVGAKGGLIDLVRYGNNKDLEQVKGTGLQRDRRVRQSPLGKADDLVRRRHVGHRLWSRREVSINRSHYWGSFWTGGREAKKGLRERCCDDRPKYRDRGID